MKAAYLTRQGGPEALEIGELPRREPGRDEILVRIHATAVTPTEFKWAPTHPYRTAAALSDNSQPRILRTS